MDNQSDLIKHEASRTREFQPNRRLDARIAELRALLEPIQETQRLEFESPKFPVVLIVGNPRSGSTVLTQFLAASGRFAYPSNFLARFAFAPQIGAMIQQMLFDPEYDFRGELSDIQSSCRLASTLGKTSGALGINEFFHFWRRFFPNYDPGYLSPEEMEQVDVGSLRQELAAIESVFLKPFMGKGKIFQYNIYEFSRLFPEFIFIHIKRDPRFVMQSVLEARRKYYGTERIWWGTKPRQHQWLTDLDPAYQIAGQVLFTEKDIDRQLECLDPARYLTCQYETFCTNPYGFFQELRKLLALSGYDLETPQEGMTLVPGNTIRLPKSELNMLEAAYADLATSG